MENFRSLGWGGSSSCVYVELGVVIESPICPLQQLLVFFQKRVPQEAYWKRKKCSQNLWVLRQGLLLQLADEELVLDSVWAAFCVQSVRRFQLESSTCFF